MPAPTHISIWLLLGFVGTLSSAFLPRRTVYFGMLNKDRRNDAHTFCMYYILFFAPAAARVHLESKGVMMMRQNPVSNSPRRRQVARTRPSPPLRRVKTSEVLQREKQTRDGVLCWL